MDISTIIESSAYFLALINPVSKIFLLSTMEPTYSWCELYRVSLRSSFVALAILAFLTAIGSFLFSEVFHVELYSLDVAGGIVLFSVGLQAVRKGRYYENSELQGVPDITIVPLAAPLIAGPGTITAAISYSSAFGAGDTTLCVTIALVLNLALMLTSLKVGKWLEKVNATGPLIRISGLIVMSVAVQMVFNGIGIWVETFD